MHTSAMGSRHIGDGQDDNDNDGDVGKVRSYDNTQNIHKYKKSVVVLQQYCYSTLCNKVLHRAVLQFMTSVI